jgi:hypothetical protein
MPDIVIYVVAPLTGFIAMFPLASMALNVYRRLGGRR